MLGEIDVEKHLTDQIFSACHRLYFNFAKSKFMSHSTSTPSHILKHVYKNFSIINKLCLMEIFFFYSRHLQQPRFSDQLPSIAYFRPFIK